VCAAAWLADIASKCWALNHDHASIVVLIPGALFALVPPVQNIGTGTIAPGVVLGNPNQFIQHATIVFPIILTVAAIVLITQIKGGRPRSQASLTVLEQMGLGMLFGGTFSNLYDRLVQHSVTDFLNTPIWGSIMWNIADAAVAFGLFFAGLEALRLGRLLPRPRPEEPGSKPR